MYIIDIHKSKDFHLHCTILEEIIFKYDSKGKAVIQHKNKGTDNCALITKIRTFILSIKRDCGLAWFAKQK